MLTEADAKLRELAEQTGKEVSIHLYGQEINPETYAICKADLLIKEEEERNIAYGSTLSGDAFPSLEFDFMLANPPYGKSWKTDLDRLCGGVKKEIRDSRFVVEHDGNPEYPLTTRSSDGQLMFLVSMLSKIKRKTPLGSRIAIVHNGSSLFTGDAGQGESNIRRWIIENDWLECIIGLPESLFYNTGIATYIWVLTNRKPEHRKGKVQLIDATGFHTKLRRNLGQKNCEMSASDRDEIMELYLDFEETPESKILDNEDFGYRKVTVERPLRVTTQVTPERMARFRETADPKMHPLADAMLELFSPEPQRDFNQVRKRFASYLKKADLKLRAPDEKLVWSVFAEKDAVAEPVAKRVRGGVPDYEPDPDLRDTESIPLKESVQDYFIREVLPSRTPMPGSTTTRPS